jgi:hypothetical protein
MLVYLRIATSIRSTFIERRCTSETMHIVLKTMQVERLTKPLPHLQPLPQPQYCGLQSACPGPVLLKSESPPLDSMYIWTHSACSANSEQGPNTNAPPTCRPSFRRKFEGAMNGYVSICSFDEDVHVCSHMPYLVMTRSAKKVFAECFQQVDAHHTYAKYWSARSASSRPQKPRKRQ